MGGVTSGKFEVKACGKAHAWCRVCRPAQAAAQRRPKPPREQYERPCRNCGRCDSCLGIEAPEGMKVCRDCRETKPITAFARRSDTGGHRNQCIKCRNGGQDSPRCEGCGKTFARFGGTRTLCAACRPPLTKPCGTCGKQFVGSMDQRRYCSVECREVQVADQRKTARDGLRMRALRAYSDGDTPSCSCCREFVPQFLALDHINGGGRKQRQELGGGGFWTWLRANNYPPGFRVLCHNCNFGRQINGGVCPHEEMT